MGFVNGEMYSGLEEDQYDFLMQFEWFRNEWADNFTRVSDKDYGSLYLFTDDHQGDEDDMGSCFIDALLDNGVVEIEGLGGYVYLSSTQGG